MNNNVPMQTKHSIPVNTVISVLVTVISALCIASYNKVSDGFEKKIKTLAAETIDRIIIPAPVRFHETVKTTEITLNPLKQGRLHEQGRFTNTREVLQCARTVTEKILLTVSASASARIDGVSFTRRPAGTTGGAGFLLTRIFIDEIKCSGDSVFAPDALLPELTTHCSHQVILEPGHYKIRVETTGYGYLSRPWTKVTLTGTGVSNISPGNQRMPGTGKPKPNHASLSNKNHARRFEQYRGDRPPGSIAGAGVKKSSEAPHGKSKPLCAPIGVQYPTAPENY